MSPPYLQVQRGSLLKSIKTRIFRQIFKFEKFAVFRIKDYRLITFCGNENG